MDAIDTRSLSRIVLADGWAVTKVGETDEAALRRAIAELSNPVPLADEDPALSGEVAKRLDQHLRPIGAKVAPEISAEAAKAWRAAMMMALSDLPGRVAVHATAKAVHRPYNFLNQVEAAIREIAAEATAKQAKALWRMKQWLAEIERARMPQPQLEAPADDTPFTAKEIRGLTPDLRRMALGKGWITQEEIDAAGENNA